MNPLRIVLDSNVVISGFLFGGPPARLLQHVIGGQTQCFASLSILDEIRDVLRRPKFGLSPEQALSFVEEFHEVCRIVTPREIVQAIPADPDDNAVLECAWEAAVDLVVSGDAHLLALQQWRGVRIVSPAEAIAEIEMKVSGPPRSSRDLTS